uniref:Biotin--protein ligase isoform X1 n=1 Tax=Hirondellea gigas TaxID=1518452 RepID=A0A6A7FUU6_9CRUS
MWREHHHTRRLEYKQPIVFQPYCRTAKIPRLRSRLYRPPRQQQQRYSSSPQSSLSIESNSSAQSSVDTSTANAHRSDQLLKFSSTSSSSSDSTSKSISTDSSDEPLPPFDVRMFCPRGWAMSGQRVVLGQPLVAEKYLIGAEASSSVVVATTSPSVQSGMLTNLYSGHTLITVGAPGTNIRTNPLGDLWMDMENRRKMACDNRITEESSIESSLEQHSSGDMLTSADLATSIDSEEASFDTSESIAGSVYQPSPCKLSSEDSSSGLSKDHKRTQKFFEAQAKMSEMYTCAVRSGGVSSVKAALSTDLPPVMVHTSKGGTPQASPRVKRQVKKKKKLQAQQEFDIEGVHEVKKEARSPRLTYKDSSSTTTTEESMSLEAVEKKKSLLSELDVTGVKTKQKVKSPFRTASQQDLLRATAIIKENLTNIVENYLVQSLPTEESVSPTKAALDRKVQSYKRFSQEFSDVLSINSINSRGYAYPLHAPPSHIIMDTKKDSDSLANMSHSNISSEDELSQNIDCNKSNRIDKSLQYKTKVIPQEELVSVGNTPEDSTQDQADKIKNESVSAFFKSPITLEPEKVANLPNTTKNELLDQKTEVSSVAESTAKEVATPKKNNILHEVDATSALVDVESVTEFKKLRSEIPAALNEQHEKKSEQQLGTERTNAENLSREHEEISVLHKDQQQTKQIPRQPLVCIQQNLIKQQPNLQQQQQLQQEQQIVGIKQQQFLEKQPKQYQQRPQLEIISKSSSSGEEEVNKQRPIVWPYVELEQPQAQNMGSREQTRVEPTVALKYVSGSQGSVVKLHNYTAENDPIHKLDSMRLARRNDKAERHFSKVSSEESIQQSSFKQRYEETAAGHDNVAKRNIAHENLAKEMSKDSGVQEVDHVKVEGSEVVQKITLKSRILPQNIVKEICEGETSSNENKNVAKSLHPKLVKFNIIEDSFEVNFPTSNSEKIDNTRSKDEYEIPINSSPSIATAGVTSPRTASQKNITFFVEPTKQIIRSPREESFSKVTSNINSPSETVVIIVNNRARDVKEHPSIDIIDETGMSCPYDETQERFVVTLEDIAAKIDRNALAGKLTTQLSDLVSDGSFESLPYNALFSQSGSFNDDSDAPPVKITFYSYQHYETVRRLVRQRSSGSEDMPDADDATSTKTDMRTQNEEPVESKESENAQQGKIEAGLDKFGMVDINIVVAEESEKQDESSGTVAVTDATENSVENANKQFVTDVAEVQEAGGLTVIIAGSSTSGNDSGLGRSPNNERDHCEVKQDMQAEASALHDSGIETSISDVNVQQDATASNKGLPSPVDSVPESGFSSLKETFAPEHNLSEDSPEMTLSKSKDSLDFTDNERFPGTDTLSDDIETLSYNNEGVSAFASRTVSVEESFRGSAFDLPSLDSISNGLVQLQSCGISRVLPDIDLDSLVIPNNHVEKALCRQLALQSTLTIQDSKDIPYQEPLHKESPSENDSVTEKYLNKSEKYGSEEGSSAGIKTSDSISSEDTILSRISMDEQNKLSTDDPSSRISSDEQSRVSLEEASRLSSTDQSKMSVDEISKISSTDQCSIDSQFLSLDDPSLGPVLFGQTSLSKIDPQESIFEEDEPTQISATNVCREKSEHKKDSFTDQSPICEKHTADQKDVSTKELNEPDDYISKVTAELVCTTTVISDIPTKEDLFGITLAETEAKSLDEDTLQALTSAVKNTLPHLLDSHTPKPSLAAFTPFPSVDTADQFPTLPQGTVLTFPKYKKDSANDNKKQTFAEIVEESEDVMEAASFVSNSMSNLPELCEPSVAKSRSTRPKSHDVHRKRKKRSERNVTSFRDVCNTDDTNNAIVRSSSSSLKSKLSSKDSRGSLASDADGSKSMSPVMHGTAAQLPDQASSRPTLANFTSSSGSTQDDDTNTKATRIRKPMSEKHSGLSNFGSASSSIHSDDSNLHFENVSLRSDGSLDKFPHFDAVRAQVKPRTPKKKRQSYNVEEKKESKLEFMHRSVTLPVGSLLSKKGTHDEKSHKKDEHKKEKDETKQKKKKKEKDLDKTEKRSAMSSIKGLLKRNKSKDKEKETVSEKTSPSLFRRLERKGKSNSPSPQPEDKPKSSASTPSADKPSIQILKETLMKVSPSLSFTDDKCSDPAKVLSEVSLRKKKPISSVDIGFPASTIRTSSSSSTKSSGAGTTTASMPHYQPILDESPSNSSQCSPRHSTPPSSPRKGSALSPKLYRRVLTRNISSSQESLDASLPSPQMSPHERPGTASSLHSLSGARELMGSPAPAMGTRAQNQNTISVTIGFKPQVQSRPRTRSEGTHLNNVPSVLPDVSGPVESSGTPSPTKLGKRSTSMEILVCGKIREHCSNNGSAGGGFSREGSFRLHREISVETLFEVPEGSPGKSISKENYQEYLNRVQASRDSQQSSTWSLCDIAESQQVDKFPDAEAACQTLPRPARSVAAATRHQHAKFGKKMSLPHNLYISERSITPDREGGSNPNLHIRSGSPYTRGMPYSSSFTSSPYKRPHSASASSVTATFSSPLKKTFYTSAAAAARGVDAGGGDTASPAPLEEVSEELESARSSVSPEPVPRSSTGSPAAQHKDKPSAQNDNVDYSQNQNSEKNNNNTLPPVKMRNDSAVKRKAKLIKEDSRLTSATKSGKPVPGSNISRASAKDDVLVNRTKEDVESKRRNRFDNKSLIGLNGEGDDSFGGSVATFGLDGKTTFDADGDAKESEEDFDYNSKPPNILVYAANNQEYFESIKRTLLACFKKDRYVVYHLNNDTAFRSPWMSSTTLLVICGDVQTHISTVFIRYLLGGGRVLSICSDFLNVAVPLFGTVEVAESDVVSVKYGRWGSVQFLHHQHCSHSSPQNNRFSTCLDSDDTPGTVPKRSDGSATGKKGGTVSVEPTHVEIRDTDGVSYCLQLRVLATDDTWGAPSLIGAKIKGGPGRGVFSQVHLERGPSLKIYASSAVTAESLRRSATARREILKDLLQTELLLDTTDLEDDDGLLMHEGEEDDDDQQQTAATSAVCYKPAILMGTQQVKEELLSKLRGKLLGGRELHRPQLRLVFLTGPDADGDADGLVPETGEDVLPVLCHQHKQQHCSFDQHAYFQHLKTEAIGRLLLYCEVISSSARVIEGATQLLHGIVVVPRIQTKGVGRGGNVWLSPEGCLMFSLQLHLSLSSFLGSHLPLLQHIVSLAVVHALPQQQLQLSLKWPNDVYAGNEKIAGVLVTATHTGTVACVNVGVGLNLSNEAPTTSIQQLLDRHNEASGSGGDVKLQHEVVLAGILNQLETLMTLVETQGPEPLLHMYYRCWKHGGAQVKVLLPEEFAHRNTGRASRSVTITGIDYYGFLKGVDSVTGEAMTIHPDGNSFNMMEGLIYTKVT